MALRFIRNGRYGWMVFTLRALRKTTFANFAFTFLTQWTLWLMRNGRYGLVVLLCALGVNNFCVLCV